MSTPTTVLKQLNALLDKINTSTGLTDATLTNAVQSLLNAHAALDENASSQAAELSALQVEHTALTEAYASLEEEHTAVTDMLAHLIERSVTTLTSAEATKVADYALYGCTALTYASFPAATSVGTYGFNRCTTMTDVHLPQVKTIGSYAFRQCYMLTAIDLPSVTSISSYAFESNVRLTALILRSPTRCTLSETNAFNSCYHILGTVSASFNPDGLKDGYIYVPRTLADGSDGVAAYEAASNWSSFAGQFRAIEDYPDICGTSQ